MKAMVLNTYGPEAEFEVAEMPDPVATPGHVVVKIAASSVNTVHLRDTSGSLGTSTDLR